MTKEQLLAAYHRWLVEAEIHDSAYRKETAEDIVRMVGPVPTPMGNMAMYTGPMEFARFRSAVEREITYFASLGHGFECKWVEGLAPDGAEELLREKGFAEPHREVALALDIGATPPMEAQCPFEVRRLTTPEDLALITDLHEAVHEGDFSWLTESLIAEYTHAPDKMCFWGAFDGGTLIGSGWLRIDRDGRGALHGGMVRPQYRRKGIFRTIVARRLEDARERGLRVLLVEASPHSRPILHRLGFTELAETVPYRKPPLHP